MKKYFILPLCLILYLNAFSQAKLNFEDWKFLSVGALIGYQYQQSSLAEFGVGTNLEYKFLYLSSSFSVENEFNKKILGFKGNFQLGFGWRLIYAFGGISYISYKEQPTDFLDNVLRAEVGIYIPVGFLIRSPYKHVRFNLKACYTNNTNLDPIEISALGKHGFNISMLFGYGFHLKPKLGMKN